MKTPIYVALLSVCLATRIVCTAADVISRPPSASLSAGGSSFRPAISADGSRLVFVSQANNLVTNDNRREWLDVFSRDLVTSNTVLVSVTSTGLGGGNGNSTAATISSNGQIIAFASEAGDLVNGDVNDASDVFVRDLVSGTARLISRSFQGNVLMDNSPSIIPLSGNPLITSDGRFVFFESRAPEISYGIDMNNAVDVFRCDLLSNETVLVSSRIPFEGVREPANAASILSSITPNGQRVAFISSATNLASGVSNSLGEVYVRDMASNITYWASASLNYPDGYRCANAALSENGRYVAFTVVPLFRPTAVYRRDLASNALLLIETNVLERATPQISADGRYVAFETGTNIFRWDAASGQAELVNVAMTGLPPTNGVARNAAMTADGNSVVFVSDSGDLTTNNSVGGFQIYARNMAGSVTHLISVAADGKPGGLGSEVSQFALARDLPRVAFDSAASDLVEGDGNRVSDVFVRDLSSATTQLISTRAPSLPRTTGIGHALLGTDSVSADGRFIAFTSYDNDSVSGDTNGWSDVFIHDTGAGSTITAGLLLTNFSRFPVMSSDGKYVAYIRCWFLSGAIWPSPIGIFRFDKETGTNAFVGSPTFAFTFGPTKCAMSMNGNLIAFRANGNLLVRNMTHGTNLNLGSAESIYVSGEADVDAVFSPDGRFLLFKTTQIYAYDFVSNRTHLVSGSIPFNSGPVGYGHGLTISGNSRFAVFRSSSAGLVIHDLLSETNGFVADGRYPSINADGRYVAFQLDQQSDPWFRQVVVQDRQSGTLELVTRNPAGAPATPILFHPTVISGDARYVLFGEWATNLVSNDTNRLGDVFVRDRLLGTTTLISRNAEGNVGNAASSFRLTMAADGRTVLFQSLASDLVAGDYNDKRDIFVLKLGGADTDGDGMDDDWEIAYFETKARDGNGDHDGDGSSDRNEFLAGTDPTNAGSIFRVLTVAPAGGGSKTLFWSGNPDRSYRAEFKDDLSAAGWTALTGTVSWNGSSASISDPSAGGATNRYYRVVRLP